MVEGDVLENHVLPDIRLCMASPSEATDVAHFVVGFFNSPPRNDIGEAQLDIPKLRHQVITESGLVVAFGAGYILVRGGPPRIDVDLHVVA
jgi:hypothetical protein